MAKLKLSELPAVTSRTGADTMYIVQNGASKQISTATLLANIFTAGAGIQIENNNMIIADVTSSFSGDTDAVPEGANLYFTNARSVAALTAGDGILIDANGTVSANIDYIANANVIQDLVTTNDRILFALTAGPGIIISANGMISVDTANVFLMNFGALEANVDGVIDYGGL
jgi:hypothetical protein